MRNAHGLIHERKEYFREEKSTVGSAETYEEEGAERECQGRVATRRTMRKRGWSECVWGSMSARSRARILYGSASDGRRAIACRRERMEERKDAHTERARARERVHTEN